MKHQYDGFNWMIRLQKGESLVENLIKFARQENIRGGWISGIGGALSVELAFYDLPAKSYKIKEFDKLLEITSLQGNIAWVDKDPVVHIHGTFSDANMQSIGGHVKELRVGGTCEIFIHNWFHDKLTRSIDDVTGLTLLDL